MLWYPVHHLIRTCTANRSQLLITHLQPAEDDNRRRLLFCDANEPIHAPVSRLPSISANLSSHTFSCRPLVHSSSPLIVHLFFSTFASLSLSLPFQSIFFCLPTLQHVSQAQWRDSAPTMDLFTHIWLLQARWMNVHTLCFRIWEERKWKPFESVVF